LALRFAWSGRREAANAPASDTAARSLTACGLARAASMLLGFLVSVASAQWGRSACDAMAINWLLVGACGGLGLVIVSRTLRRSAAAARLVSPRPAWAAASLAFVLAEPRCVHGPFALIDPGVKMIWLDQ